MPLPLSPKSLRVLDKHEVLAAVTEQPRFLPWTFNTGSELPTSEKVCRCLIIKYIFGFQAMILKMNQYSDGSYKMALKHLITGSKMAVVYFQASF